MLNMTCFGRMQSYKKKRKKYKHFKQEEEKKDEEIKINK